MSIITKDKNGYLTYANDTLKNNLAIYINEYRLIGDSIDILDAKIVNLAVRFTITVENTYNEQNVMTRAITKLKEFLKTNNFQIDQPNSKNMVYHLPTWKWKLINKQSIDLITAVFVFHKT